MDWFLYDRDLYHERVKPTSFLLIRETRKQWQIFEADFVQKPLPETYLETSRTSTIKLPCDFCKKTPP